MYAPIHRNQKKASRSRWARFEPHEVVSISGYRDGQCTKVTLMSGRVLYLDMPVESVRTRLGIEEHEVEVLRRALAQAKARRGEVEAEHPEFRPYFDLLAELDAALTAEAQEWQRDMFEGIRAGVAAKLLEGLGQ